MVVLKCTYYNNDVSVSFFHLFLALQKDQLSIVINQLQYYRYKPKTVIAVLEDKVGPLPPLPPPSGQLAAFRLFGPKTFKTVTAFF